MRWLDDTSSMSWRSHRAGGKLGPGRGCTAIDRNIFGFFKHKIELFCEHATLDARAKHMLENFYPDLTSTVSGDRNVSSIVGHQPSERSGFPNVHFRLTLMPYSYYILTHRNWDESWKWKDRVRISAEGELPELDDYNGDLMGETKFLLPLANHVWNRHRKMHIQANS